MEKKDQGKTLGHKEPGAGATAIDTDVQQRTDAPEPSSRNMDKQQESIDQDGFSDSQTKALDRNSYPTPEVPRKVVSKNAQINTSTPSAMRTRDKTLSTLSPSLSHTSSTCLSPGNTGGFGKMLAAAEQQRQRPLKKLQLLRRQREQQQQAALDRANKEAQQQLRARVHAAQMEQQRAEKAKQDAMREVRRQEVAQAAVARLEEVRRTAEEKVARHAELTAAALAEKSAQHAQLRSRLEALEHQRKLAAERRLAQQKEEDKRLFAKERAAEEARRRKQAELAEAEEKRKAEETAREAERQATIRRAELLSTKRNRELELKGAAKEAAVRQRQLQADADARAARYSEAQQQEAAARQRMQLKARQDEEAARQLVRKYEEKVQRSRQFSEQRKALTSELQRVRVSIAEQERLLKESFATMAKRGKLEPSAQLLQLEKMAINTALPDSPFNDLIPAYSGFSTPRSTTSMPRITSSKLRNTVTTSRAGSKREKSQAPGKSKVEISAPQDSPTGNSRALERCLAGNHKVEAWHDESDGTIVGSLGYGKVLESPAVAYEELQAQLLAYAEEHAPDSEAQQAHVQ
ncbi:probable reticulocyte-binding protein 2 homolog a at N-terminal half [Coccomyxa sp. Obi]|nr:probable reticulocyte-binding protein 2 homolog a at N-terminal half [Coccomyxa sp. Obi]